MKSETVQFYTLRYFLYLFFLCFAGFNWQVTGQSNIRLTGNVYDATDSSPIFGALIQIDETQYLASTNQDGLFVFENVKPAVYDISVSSLGYRTFHLRKVKITVDQAHDIQVMLYPQPIEGDSVFVISQSTIDEYSLEGDKLILTSEEITKYRTLGLQRLLQRVPGIQIESKGSGFSSASIKIHGSRANQVLVLLDGQRLNDPQTGEADLNLIPIDQIEKIEVIRQGNTALFGSNAFAGIINFQSKSIKNNNYTTLRSEFGSYKSAMGSVSLALHRSHFGLLTNYQQDYSKQNFTFTYHNGKYERMNAWYRNRKLFGKLTYSFKRNELRVLYNYHQGKQGLPSAFYEEMNHFNARKKGNSHSFQINDKYYLSSHSYLEAFLGYHMINDLYNNEEDFSPFTRYKLRQKNENYQGKVNIFYYGKKVIDSQIGFQYLAEQLNHENLLFPVYSIGKKVRDITAGYGGFDIRMPNIKQLISKWKVITVLRYEKYFNQRGRWYPHIGINILPEWLNGISISTSWGKSTRYPDFNSLFWKGDTRARGNPDLLPERKKTWNTSARFQPAVKYLPSFSFFYYSEEIDNLIFWHQTVGGIWEPRNEERVHKEGVDFQFEHKIFTNRLHFQAAYSYVEAINKSSEPNRYNKKIVFTPQHTLNTSLWLRISDLTSLINYRYVSDREIVPANTGNPLSVYHLWDITFSYQRSIVNLHYEVECAVKNLTDTSYQLLRGYPMPGREFQFSVKLKYLNK